MVTTPRNAKSIFLEAVEKYQPDQWDVFLDGACGDDADLRLRVEELLKAHRESDSLLDQPEATVDFRRGEAEAGTTIGRYRLMEQIGEGVLPLPCDDILGLDEALRKLERKDPRKAELVKLRFFAGLTIAQAAQALEISTSTADNNWAYARSWLRLEMSGGDEP